MKARFLAALFVGLCVIAVMGTACAQSPRARYMPQQHQGESPAEVPQQGLVVLADPSSVKEYVLGVGDRLRLTVYGEDDLSGDYEVNSTGVVALPLIGNIQAAQLTVRAFEDTVRTKLASGYLRDPRVSVQVSNYRPFFILGEVAKPGSYPYVNGMNVLNAVAMAGGYTYRADKGDIVIVHANDPSKKEVKAREDAPVMPGDVVRVPERFF